MMEYTIYMYYRDHHHLYYQMPMKTNNVFGTFSVAACCHRCDNMQLCWHRFPIATAATAAVAAESGSFRSRGHHEVLFDRF